MNTSIPAKRHFSYKLLSIFTVMTLLLTLATPVRAAPEPLPEPYTDLYVIYSEPNADIISIEIRDQTRLSNGRVRAAIAVRAESLIAYNLTFHEMHSTGEAWEELDFLPLYPGRIYELSTITFEPGGHFTVTATKFGEDESVVPKMTLVQLCILALHLVGAKPPMEWREFPQAVADSFDDVIGPIGAIAGALSAVLEIFSEEPDIGDALLNIADAVDEFTDLSDVIAKGVNLIVKEGPQVTGNMIGNVFKALDVLNIVGNVKRTWDAYRQLKDLPPFAQAKITLAPIVTEWPDRYSVVEINKIYQTRIAFRNVGSELLLPEQGYELLVLWGQFPVGYVPLDRTIRIGQTVYWDVSQRAPPIPGVYRINYQLALGGVPIGSLVPAEIVVVPENSDNLTELINGLVDEARQKAGERFDEIVEELEQRIMEAIIAEIERRLREICGGTTSAILMAGTAIWLGGRRRRRRGP